MKTGYLLLFLVLMLLTLMSPVQAQHSLFVPISIERAVRENAPEWTLIFVDVRKTTEENSTNFRWKRENQEVAVFVSEHRSTEEARITPESLVTAAPRRQTKVEHVGDEAYLISPSPYGHPRFDVIFRRGKVRVSVEAASADVAKRMAKHIADALPDAQR